jgi:hypothetical protein
MRFGVYNELLSVMKQQDESLQSVAGGVSEALTCVQELRPESFTIVQLDEVIKSGYLSDLGDQQK